jgi:hypothetical protein
MDEDSVICRASYACFEITVENRCDRELMVAVKPKRNACVCGAAPCVGKVVPFDARAKKRWGRGVCDVTANGIFEILGLTKTHRPFGTQDKQECLCHWNPSGSGLGLCRTPTKKSGCRRCIYGAGRRRISNWKFQISNEGDGKTPFVLQGFWRHERRKRNCRFLAALPSFLRTSGMTIVEGGALSGEETAN